MKAFLQFFHAFLPFYVIVVHLWISIADATLGRFHLIQLFFEVRSSNLLRFLACRECGADEAGNKPVL